ncbi:hypothetical protein AK812_SmicGene34613 [Symbiodinium microadriaticum]|uniref:Uncharacterized protein n=1 Tax=Symbiodinium microadriaticum TaxID=2951 RepID=A0A1Q9CNK8_SYMMI|nr:hypothetical protein AK812_SmicGene34613 [Symbiodinium microadriaticum]
MEGTLAHPRGGDTTPVSCAGGTPTQAKKVAVASSPPWATEDDVPATTPPRKQAPRSPEPRAEALGGALYWPGEEGNAADRRRSPPRTVAPAATVRNPATRALGRT